MYDRAFSSYKADEFERLSAEAQRAEARLIKVRQQHSDIISTARQRVGVLADAVDLALRTLDDVDDVAFTEMDFAGENATLSPEDVAALEIALTTLQTWRDHNQHGKFLRSFARGMGTAARREDEIDGSK